MAVGAVTDTGISVVYEPEDPSSAVVDIVFVHGLQGHPRGTWTKGKIPKSPRHHQSLSEPETLESLKEKKAKRGSLAWISKKLKRMSLTPGQAAIDDVKVRNEASDKAAISSLDPSSRNTTNVSTASVPGTHSGVFWPADLLPQACPRARILVFGYDTKITNYGAAATNKNSIYSHAKDLLFALSRETEGCVDSEGKQRQIIFVAHSLGGIVVKEMLSLSSTSTEPQHSRIVESTAGVVFLGTPHRGSPDFAAAGDWARTFVSFFGAETSPAILHALGLKTTDLQRAQESFSGLWMKHSFRVKTFQEGLGLTGINFGALGSKVVPDYSSSLGDQREHAETIQANHREMCRFYGTDDPGYRKVSGELQLIYLSIEKRVRDPLRFPAVVQSPSIASSVNNQNASVKGSIPISVPISVNSFDLWEMDKVPFSEAEKTFLTSLWYPDMNSRRKIVASPADGTCNWLFQNPVYVQWIEGESQENHNGLLQIKGSPGSGKSVLVKEAYRRALQTYARSGYCIAAFFFNGNGGALEKSKQGLFRSLLYQLLPQDRESLARAAKEYTAWGNGIVNQSPSTARNQQDPVCFPVQQLEHTLRSFLVKPSRQRAARRTLIFIDALDECSSLEDRMALSYFLGATSVQATRSKANLSILMSNRNFPFLTVGSHSGQVDMNQLNLGDVNKYVEQRLALGITAVESERILLQDVVCKKARGVFLWVVLAVDGIIERWQQGQSLLQIRRHLDDLPDELNVLYAGILISVPPETKQVTLRLFQWAILANRPLQLREWHDLMAFISRTRGPSPKSLKECQDSDEFTTTDDQLERKVRALSKGLLEVAVDNEEPWDDAMAMSVSNFAGAGSFMMNPGETRIIQVIHDTVNEYFKLGNGFDLLSDSFPRPAQTLRIIGHVAIMSTCLDYLGISELDALVDARIRAAKQEWRKGLKARLKSSMQRLGPGGAGNIEMEDLSTGLEYHSPIGPEGVDIVRWLAGIVPLDVIDTGTNKEANRLVSIKLPSRQSSCSVHTQRLEAYPALMQYATDEFFSHAGYCLDDLEPHDANWQALLITPLMLPVMERLCHKDFSRRWLALREELHVEFPVDATKPLSFTEYLLKIDPKFGLVFQQIPFPPPTPPPVPPRRVASAENLDTMKQRLVHKQHEELVSHDEMLHGRQVNRPQSESYRMPRRKDSVRSFRSAASAGSQHSRHSRR